MMMMSEKRTSALALVCGLGLSLQFASAQTVATSPGTPVPAKCQLSQPARIVTSLRELPDVANEFRRLKLDVADIGERFIPFDVEDASSKGLPHRQFVRAYVFKDKTIAWYYRGGFATSFHVVELTMQREATPDAPQVLRMTGRTLSGPPCAATEAILAGVNGGQGW
jgi:hypothetical protein